MPVGGFLNNSQIEVFLGPLGFFNNFFHGIYSMYVSSSTETVAFQVYEI